MLYLRAASADRRKIFRHDWKSVILNNVGTNIGGVFTKKNYGNCFFLHFGPKSPSSLDRSPRNYAKWPKINGALKVSSEKFRCPLRKKMWGSQNAFGEKSPVNCGPLTTPYYKHSLTHPNQLLRETIFRPLEGAADSNFYTRYIMTKAYQRTRHRKRGPPNNF